MNVKALLFTLMLAIVPAPGAQSPQMPTIGFGSPDRARADHRQEMMETHKQQMEAMGADIAKMKASLAEMKANLLTIRDTNEMARWRNNVDLWETMVGHMEQMQKQMESMGQGSMEPTHRSMEGQPPRVMVKVNGRPWKLVTSFTHSGPTDTSYKVETKIDKTTVIFGDGVQGAKPPSGSNVEATYWTGTGAGGEVRVSYRVGPTLDQALWVAICNSAHAISFER